MERIYGIHNGGNDKVARSGNSTSGEQTQKDIAEKLGISLDILKRAKKLTTLSPEIQQLIEEDKISATTAYKLIAKLSPTEQEELIKSLPITEKFERMEYALRLAKIEGLKAKERMKSGKADPCQMFGKGVRTDEIVAEKLGIGSKETYRKEKYIYENQSSLPSERMRGLLNSWLNNKI